jgi:transcriptional regulator of arginine metabolism
LKTERQRAILRLIAEEPIETQLQLANKLKSKGFKVTQATVSRDIKELGLIKIPGKNNKYNYAAPPEHRVTNVLGRLERMFQDSVVSFEESENLILVKTLPGTAHAVASCLDNITWKEIIGTVAGDDTILVIIKPKEAVGEVMEKFRSLL